MDKNKTHLLENLRTALGRGPAGLGQARRAREEMAQGRRPRRREPPDCAQERFAKQLERASGTSVRLRHAAEVPRAIHDYLTQRGLPERACLADHPLLTGLDWPFSVSVFANPGSAQADVGISVASAGVAENGTVVMSSGPSSPASLCLLPERHIVVLETGALVDDMEALWSRQRGASGFPPRAVQLITGPSRTADVEQTLYIGAHGPRALHVVLLQQPVWGNS